MPRLLPLALLAFAARPAVAADPVDYNKDVRPILVAACVQCHGEDKKARKANLRFDTPGWVSDITLVVPGKSAKSDVYTRMTTTGRGAMPPKNFERQVTKDELALLKRWIDEGAKAP